MPIIREVATGRGMQALAGLADFNQRLAEQCFRSLQSQHFPCVIGGDHSCAIGTWSGIAAHLRLKNQTLRRGLEYERPGLFWIDAHMDSHTPESTETGNIHGMPLAVLLGEGEESLVSCAHPGAKIAAGRSVLFGVRSFESGEALRLARLGVRVFHSLEIQNRGFEVCWQEARDIVCGAGLPFGVSLDLDAFDPQLIPAVGTPVRAGLRPEHILRSLPSLIRLPELVGFEIVEFNPSHDHGHRSLSFLVELMHLLQNTRSHWGPGTRPSSVRDSFASPYPI